MNFFTAQEEARKASRRLVLWFGLCVIGVILTVYTMLVVGIHYANIKSDGLLANWWQAELFLITFVAVGGIILAGSLAKLAKLSGGGSVIARDLGGRQVEPCTRDPKERRLLNVVEEMSIASGTSIPEVWVMDDEEGINAFAAGTDPSNAVIGVTKGTLEQLTRSELQGVIAHEYSHILNGDMKLNMRLTGWIFGLVMIALVGRIMLESLRFVRGSRDSKGGVGIVLAIALFGVAVWIIGSIGVLFARMIQAAISRQREFLADASAVQFTRYPDGISGALKKIGGYAQHGKIEAAKASEARHMFFASSSLSSVLATHPPLDQRIKAIEPNWNGEMLEGGTDAVSKDEFTCAPESANAASTGSSATPPPIPGSRAIQDAAGSAGGIPGMNATTAIIAAAAIAEEEAQAIGLIQAQGLMFGLLIATNDHETGRRILTNQGYDETLIQVALTASSDHSQGDSQHKLTCVDAALPWLRAMNHQQARNMITTIKLLTEADGEINLFEFMLTQVSQRHIEIGLGLRQPPTIQFRRIAELESEVANLLAVFSSVSGDDNALEPAAAEYMEHTTHELPRVTMDFNEAASGLQRMDRSSPIVKQQILRLCWLTANQDGQINDHEAELLRAVAEALGCALPRTDNGFADLT
ncbi:MAG: M48 family metallopeptidase [Luteolibacter sp.]